MAVASPVACLAGVLVLATCAGAAAEWQTFTFAEDGFSADFPAQPTVRDIGGMKSEAIVFFHDYRAVTEAGVFLVDVVRFTPAVRAARADTELLDIAVAAVAGNDCAASEPREVQAAGGIAHEATFRCPDALTMRPASGSRTNGSTRSAREAARASLTARTPRASSTRSGVWRSRVMMLQVKGMEF